MAEGRYSPQPQSQVAREAYKRALKIFRESLSAKEYAKITVPTTLEDVIETTNMIQERHKNSKTRQLCDALKSTKDRLDRFSNLLKNALKDVMGGELLWASVNFVFLIASERAETFTKLLEVLVTTSEKMPQFSVLANTFEESAMVIDSVEALYVAIIRFWVSAAKFYRKKRLWRLPLWNEYQIYFDNLVKELDRQEQRLRDTAQVQHIQEAKEEREESRQFRRQNTFGRMTANKIIKWLSPADIYEPNFFEIDFEKANKKRHEGTCEWILRKSLYKAWEGTPAASGRLLIVYGIPGAGKTILSSFLVHHCIHRLPPNSSRIGLYFYFDNKDEHKRSPLVVARSLVYQLYASLKLRKQDNDMQNELEMRMHSSATDRAMNYDSLWAIFRKIVQQGNIQILIVLDAMDECNGSKPFIRDLKRLAANAATHIIITSRSETDVVRVFAEGEGVPALYVTTDDVKRDIILYVQAKVEKSASLQHPQVKDSVVTALATKSGGMFLWVYLMLKVLKSLPSVADVLQALSTLPEKLDDVYERILERLHESLKPGPRAFCQLVLKWIVATSRPLLFAELVEGLKAEYNKTSSMFEHEQGFQNTLLYGRKDIELVRGSLVTVNEDSIRLIHLSTRDYLRSSAESIGLKAPLDRFLVDVPLTQNHVALTCLEYLSSRNVIESPIFTPSIDISSIARQREIAHISDQNPLFEYAVLYWPTYICSNIYSGTTEAMRHVEGFLRRRSAITWIEIYLFFSGPEYTASTAQRLSKVQGAPPLVISWADKVIEVLDEYSTTMTKASWMIHKCFRPTIIDRQFPSDSPTVQSVVHLSGDSNSASKETKHYLTDVEKGAKSWVYLDSGSKTIFMTQLIHPSMRLASQNSLDGVRYRPTLDAEEESPNGEWAVRSVAVRPGGSHIAVTFCPPSNKGVPAESFYRTILWLIRDPLKQTGVDEWAERILVDRTTSSIFRCPVSDSYIIEGRGSVLSFAEKGTLVTPGGIYNIFTEEKLYSPPQIFHPTTRITSTSFNEHRVARIRDLTELEVLSFDGQLVGTFSFPKSEVLQVCTMGYSGQKIIMTYSDMSSKRDLRRIKCVHVSSGNIIRLMSRGVSRINFCRFTTDEERLVGRISCNPDHSGSEIAVWNVDTGHVTYLFKDPDPQLSFCLHTNDTHVLIFLPTGRLIDRSMDEIWSPDEETAFLSQYAHESGSNTPRSLWQVSGSSGICKVSAFRREVNDIESSNTEHRGKNSSLNRVVNKMMSRALLTRHSPSSRDQVDLEVQRWSFNTDDTVRNLTPVEGDFDTLLAMSGEGNIIAAMGKYFHVYDSRLRHIALAKQKNHPQQIHFSPNGRCVLTVEEKKQSRLLQGYKINDDSSMLESCGSYQLDGYIMDLNMLIHDIAPIFAVTYTKMISYSGGLSGESLIASFTEGEFQFRHISGTFHPSIGFSQCGTYFFGTVSMEEADDAEIYDEPDAESLEGAGIDEPNFDEPASDDLSAKSYASGDRSDEVSPARLSPSGNVPNDSMEPESPRHEAALQGLDINHPQDSPPRGTSPSVDSDAASEIETNTYPWPKLYKLPSELRYLVTEDQQEAVKFKLGSFYVRTPHICRLRLAENMGVLYLDKARLDGAGRSGRPDSYRSRALCIVPDAFLDLSTTDIVLVWPQWNSRPVAIGSSQTSRDVMVKVVLFLSGRSNVPVIIKTGLEGPTLLDF